MPVVSLFSKHVSSISLCYILATNPKIFLRLTLVAGSNLLHVVVPGDFAGRLIGKKGAHVQERPGGVDMR